MASAEENAAQRVAEAVALKDRAEADARLQRQRIVLRATQRLRNLRREMEAAKREQDAELDARVAAVAAETAAARRQHEQTLREARNVERQLLAGAMETQAEAGAEAREAERVVAQLRIRVRDAECQVCYEEVKVTDGVRCGAEGQGDDGAAGLDAPPSHFLCRDCFADCVRSQSAEAVGDLAARRGRCVCPFAGGGCTAPPFADRVVAMNVPDDVHAEYVGAKDRLRESEMHALMERELEVRVERELEERMRLTAHEAAVRGARKHVTDKVLTLKCPRCDAAWADFDGCCALSCAQCRCGFCAYCLADCGADAHGHVGDCAYGQGGGLHGHRQLAVAHKRLRTERLRAYLPTLERAVRDEVLQACQKDLEDVGLAVRDF